MSSPLLQNTNRFCRGRKALVAGGALVILMLLVFVAYTLRTGVEESKIDVSAFLGNSEANRKTVRDNTASGEFAFAVIGDTRDLGTFEALADRLRDEPLAFMVLIGDFVAAANPGNHRFFQTEFTEELNLKYPVLLIPGNHDIDRDDYTVEDFEQAYGPSMFTIESRDCLFVFLRIVGRDDTDQASVDLVKRLAEEKATERYRKTFVFMHIPPPVFPEIEDRQYDSVDAAGKAIAKLKPDYVFSGHYHGYARKQIGATNYMITGGGGDELRKRNFGHFHHATVIRVGKDSVAEDLLVVDEARDHEDRLEKYAESSAYPWLQNNWMLAFIITIILILTLGAAYRFLRKTDAPRR